MQKLLKQEREGRGSIFGVNNSFAEFLQDHVTETLIYIYIYIYKDDFVLLCLVYFFPLSNMSISLFAFY